MFGCAGIYHGLYYQGPRDKIPKNYNSLLFIQPTYFDDNYTYYRLGGGSETAEIVRPISRSAVRDVAKLKAASAYCINDIVRSIVWLIVSVVSYIIAQSISPIGPIVVLSVFLFFLPNMDNLWHFHHLREKVAKNSEHHQNAQVIRAISPEI